MEMLNLDQLQEKIRSEVLLEAHRTLARAKAAGGLALGLSESALGAVSGRTERKALEDSLSRFDEYMAGTSEEFREAFPHGSSRLSKFVDTVYKTYEVDVSPTGSEHRQVQLNGGSMLLNIDPQFYNGQEVPDEYFYSSFRTNDN
jgi:hypothetical protein